MRNFYAGLALLLSVNASAQWDTLSSGTKATLKGVSFQNTNVGLTCGYDTASGNGRIYISTDAGNSWTAAAVTDAVYPKLHSVTYVNNYVAVAVGDSGAILRSTDSGMNWDTLTRFTGQQLNRVTFVNDTLGFCAGKGGVLFKTTDSGANWDTLNSGTVLDLYDISFISTTTGLITGDGGWIAKTSDGGASWTMVLNPFFGFFNGRSIAFRDAGNAVCVGLYGYALHSFDGGNSWSQLSLGTANDLNSVRFVTLLGGVIAGENGIIYRTSDGGLSWNIESTASQSRTYYDIAFSNDSTGYICAASGKIVSNRFDISSVKETTATAGLSAYPNPFSDRITVNYSPANAGNATLELSDLAGRMVLQTGLGQQMAGENISTFDLSGLPAGVYLLRVNAAETVSVLRIVKR